MQSMEPATEHSQSDEEFGALLAKVRSGDEAATTQLVERYQREVLRTVRSRLGRSMRDVLDSMDIMQSVHRSLLIGLQKDKFHFDNSKQLIALAATMVQRKVARKWRVIKKSPTTRADAYPGIDGLSLEGVVSTDPAVSHIASAEDLLQSFLSQLDELDQRLVHSKLAGNSSAETAQELNLDPAFVRMRWSRLRSKLRESGFRQEE
jgi:RNA polymerase sigma factor (sigma-70 family)